MKWNKLNIIGTRREANHYVNLYGDYNHNHKASIVKIDYKKRMPPNVEIPKLVLDRSNDPDDFVRAPPLLGSAIITCSQRAYNLINDYKLGDSQIFETELYNKNGKTFKYYIIYVFPVRNDIVDYDNSIFKVTYFFEKVENIDVVSSDDYSNKLMSLRLKDRKYSIKAEKLVFKPREEEDVDLTRIGEFDIGIYISDALQNALMKSSLSGIAYGVKR